MNIISLLLATPSISLRVELVDNIFVHLIHYIPLHLQSGSCNSKKKKKLINIPSLIIYSPTKLTQLSSWSREIMVEDLELLNLVSIGGSKFIGPNNSILNRLLHLKRIKTNKLEFQQRNFENKTLQLTFGQGPALIISLNVL